MKQNFISIILSVTGNFYPIFSKLDIGYSVTNRIFSLNSPSVSIEILEILKVKIIA